MAVSGENTGEVVVVGMVCHMWPRTKRNVVEARDVVKHVGRAALGLPKEPQPQKKLNEMNGAGFLYFGYVLRTLGEMLWPRARLKCTLGGILVGSCFGPPSGHLFYGFLDASPPKN